MRMTSKGQVTVPKHIRDKLGVKPGDELQFRDDGARIVIERCEVVAKVNVGLELARHLRKMGKILKRIPMTTDELMDLTRGPFDDLDTH